MTCAIVEDEPLALHILETYVQKIPFLDLKASFRSPMAAMNYLQQTPIDLLFLDINMPDLSGIQLLKSLTKAPLIIFTTAYSKYAIESYELSAVDYLLKPFELERFLKAVNKAQQSWQKPLLESISPQVPEFLFLKSGTKTFKVLLQDILYLEAAENYVSYVTKERKILVLDRLSSLEKTLPASLFVRAHKSYIVGLTHIEVLERSAVTIGTERIPIGRAYRKALFERIEKAP
jgi:DNA-binding LytR/AlgR family response regulator